MNQIIKEIIEARIDERFAIGVKVRMIGPSKDLRRIPELRPIIDALDGKTGIVKEINKGDPLLIGEDGAVISLGSATSFMIGLDEFIKTKNDQIIQFPCFEKELELI